ncbi:MAG: cupredoxin domain-containing protein [Thermoplasmatota archaeon]
MNVGTAVALAAVFAVVAGCAASTGPGPTAPPVALTFRSGPSGHETAFVPGNATVARGASVSITFVNAGVVDHTWTLPEFHADTGVVHASATGRASFVASRSGSFVFLCTVSDHAASGMHGTLTVT